MTEAGLGAPIAVGVGNRSEKIAIEAGRRRNDGRYNPRPTPSGRSISRRMRGSIASGAPSAFIASALRAHACRYSTAPVSPSRRLRHWTSRISCVVAARFGVRHQIGKRPPHQLLLGPALDRLEPGRDPRLRGKGREQRLGEGVDGLDLEPAGAIEHLARTAAARAPASADRWVRRAQQVRSELAILEPDPRGETSADAVGHLRGRRLGEGQAQDRFRPRALQQQTQHARGQDLRLAGARRRRKRGVDAADRPQAPASPLSSGSVLNRALMRLPKRRRTP